MYLNRNVWVATIFLGLLMGMPSPLFAAEKLEQWEITTKMEMDGMPFPMPGHTNKVCAAPGQKSNEKMVPVEKDCILSNVKTTANTVSYHVECTGKQKMSGDGSFTRKGNDAYSGDMSMAGNFGGDQAKMHMHFDGVKTGLCDASESPQAQADKMMAMQKSEVQKLCQSMVEDMTLHQFPESPGLSCKNQKPKYCIKVKVALADKNFDHLGGFIKQHKDWRNMASYCEINVDGLGAQLCSSAKDARNWGAVGNYCGDEGLALAKEKCGGMDYTSRAMSEYADLCHKYADEIPLPEETGVSGLFGKGKKTMEGVNKLRGMFGL